MPRNLVMIIGVASLAILTAGASAQAAHVNWRHDFRTAAAEAGRQHKPLLVKFTADWCGYCHKMKRSFDDERVARHVHACFVPVEIDTDRNARLAQSIGVQALPTTVIISPEMKIVKRITGFQTPAQLDQQLGAICHAEFRRELPAFGSRRLKPQPESTVADSRSGGRGKSERAPEPRTPGLPDHRAPTEGWSGGARPAPSTPPAPPRSSPETQIDFAFDGVCLVSLLDERTIRKGSEEFAAIYRGRWLRFASMEHLQRFAADPGRYWPALDGRCAVSEVEEGDRRMGLSRWAAVYRGRLWFFESEEDRLKFARSPQRFSPRQSAPAGE